MVQRRQSWESLGVGIALNQPLQSVLNATFAAEAATTAVAGALACIPRGCHPSESPELPALVEAAIQKNLKIQSGERGRSAVKHFSEILLDYRSPAWY